MTRSRADSGTTIDLAACQAYRARGHLRRLVQPFKALTKAVNQPVKLTTSTTVYAKIGPRAATAQNPFVDVEGRPWPLRRRLCGPWSRRDRRRHLRHGTSRP
ncbi:MAG: hypothetical protein ACLUNZ_03515 [Evtepia sp.]